jgi:hypothetical protein
MPQNLTIAPARDVDWVLNELFMLRVAGMPIEVALRLRCPQTARWADDVLAAEDELGRGRAPVGDALEAAIGASDDERVRRALIALRRDVFNLRLPRDPAAARRLACRLDPVGRKRTLDWLDVRARYEQRLAAGPELLAAGAQRHRAYLREVASDPRLRHGLLLASPSLDRYLSTYLNAPPGALSKRARRIERSLLEYVFRTACKTSPFSTLTTVALGRFAAANGVLSTAARLEPRSHTRINVGLLARLADAITAEPTLRADLPVRITSGWQADAERIRYVRRTRQIGADDTALTFDSVQENLFYLSHGAILREVLEIFTDVPQLRMGQLIDRLHALDPANRDRGELERYLHHLLRLGLLNVPTLQVDIHSDDPLRSFRDGVAGLGRPWSDALAERLDAVADHVTRYRQADLDGRRSVLDAVRDELVRAQRDLGVTEPTSPRTLVYEDVCLPDADVVADRASWSSGVLPALQSLSRILPVFDMMLPHRLTLKGFFLARYGRGGRCDDLLRFVHEFHRDFYDQFTRYNSRRQAFDNGEYVPQQNWLRVSQVDALNDGRRELVRQMRRAYGDLPPGAPELLLDDGFVDAVTDALGAGLDFDPRSFFLQVAVDGGRPLGILNRSYSGLTLLFSRFTHCFADSGDGRDGLGDRLAETLTAVQPPGAVFAEINGGYDTTNLNLHPSVTGYELVCPGETSFRPPAAQIPIDDLAVVHDADSDRIYLWSRRLGIEVIPVYLGFLLPLALPEVPRTLLLFSHTSAAALDLWGGVDPPGADRPVVARPRVRYRDVVLARRTWRVRPDSLPSRPASGSEADCFLGWQRWRREAGLPHRVFATLDLADPPAKAAADRPAVAPVKPQYVDFDTPFSLSLLNDLVQAATGRIVFTEMLPDVDQLWLHGSDGRYVTEQTVEITGVRRAAVAEPGTGPEAS